MKRVIAIGLIFLLSAQCFYNLGLIAYYHLNKEYIAEVLCINKEKPVTMCYGQCFLQRNLDIPDEAESIPLPAGKEKVEIPVFVGSECSYTFESPSRLSIPNSPYINGYSWMHSFVPFRPPAVA